MKKDIKYIIKRVISAVLIVLIVGSLKQCKVSALSSSSYYITSNRYADFGFSTSMPCLTQNTNNCFHLIDELSYDNSSIELYYYNFNYNNNNGYDNFDAISMLFLYNNKYYIFSTYFNKSNFDYSQISYIQPLSNSVNLLYPPNLFAYNSNDESIYNLGLNTGGAFQYNFYELDFDNVSYTKLGSNNYSLANEILSNGLLVSSSSPFPIKYEDNEIYAPTPSDPLEDYTKIDLTGYQSLLAVPKNYPYLASEYGYVNDNNEDYIHYTFGYENCINPVLINMSNLENWYSFSDWNDNSNDNFCGSTPTLMSLDYPLQNEDNYNYMGILIYNNSLLYNNNSNDWVNNQQNPYGTSYVYINEEYYDYYLINDYNSFNQTLDFTDFDGETTTLYISTLPTFTDLAGQVFSQQDIDDNLSTRQKIDKLLSFGKLPFDFFKRTITAECKPLKAPFPHGNFDIELPCLSSSFESFMGSALYGVVRLIINGLLVYRITMSLIVFTTKKLDPKDCSIEVGALL